jgi:hypothetical protein
MIHHSMADVIVSAPTIADADRIRLRSSALCSNADHCPALAGPLPIPKAPGSVRCICESKFGKLFGSRDAGNQVFGLRTVNHPAVPTLNPL